MRNIYLILILIGLVTSCTIKPTEDCEDCGSEVKSYEMTVDISDFSYNGPEGEYFLNTNTIKPGTKLPIAPGDMVAVYVNFNKADEWYALPQQINSTHSNNAYNEFAFAIKENYNDVTYKTLTYYIRPQNKSVYSSLVRPYTSNTKMIFRVVVAKTGSKIDNSTFSYDPQDFFKY
jgi:hypothetical protein